MRRQFTFKRLFLIMASIVYAAVFGEFFLRIVDPQPLMPRYVTGAPWGIRVNIPNVSYRHQTPEIDVTVTVNSKGMRADREYALEKPQGVCRIALLGDSYFMGYEATLADSIAGRLEARLTDEGYKVEVLNFAVSGFSTSEMIIQFEQQVQGYAPDITYFQFHASDFQENVRARLHTVQPDGSVTPTGAAYLPGIKTRDTLMRFVAYRWLIENSHFYSAIREKAALLIKSLLLNIAIIKEASAAISPVDNPEAFTGLLLGLARQEVMATGSAWYAVDIPVWSSRTVFKSVVDQLNLDPPTQQYIISPINDFTTAANTETKIYFEEGHRHLTPLGNDIVARLMAERALDENRRLFDSCKADQ